MSSVSFNYLRHPQPLNRMSVVAPAPSGPSLVVTGDSGFPNQMYARDRSGTAVFTINMDSLVPGGDLRHPIDYAFDGAGNIYVVSLNPGTTRYPIYKFDSAGNYLTHFGIAGNGSADGRCNTPTGICLDELGNMYIVDSLNQRIQKWDSTGAFVTKWGSFGTGDGQFEFASSAFNYIAYDGTYLYVADATLRRVQKFDTSGTYITKWGSIGTGTGQFTTLNGVAVAPDGTIWVVDDYYNPTGIYQTSRLQHFSNTGTYLGQYVPPNYGTGNGDLEHPNDISIDADGNIYVCDEYNDRVQKFDSSMTYVTKWSLGGGFNPQGIAVSPPAIPI